MAVGTVFFCFGSIIGLWGGSIAEVARQSAISTEVIGSAFVGFAVAGIVGFAVAGRIGRSVSLKHRLLVLLVLTAICLAVLFHISTALQLVVGLAVFSFLNASVDLVMNSEAVAVERERGFPLLAGCHGLASLGLAGGAIGGSYLSVTAGLSVTAAVSVLAFAIAFLAVAVGTPDRGATHSAESGSTWFRPAWPLVAVSLIVGASIAGETAAVMFSAQTLAAQAPELAAYAGAGATAFALCQAAVRMVGDRLRASLDDARLIRLSLIVSLLGFAIVSFSSTFAITAFGFAVIGIGTACIVPCGFAMAAHQTAQPAAAVISMLAIISGLIRIPSPLIYGFGAQSAGFSLAFGIYTLIVAGAAVVAFAMRAGPVAAAKSTPIGNTIQSTEGCRS